MDSMLTETNSVSMFLFMIWTLNFPLISNVSMYYFLTIPNTTLKMPSSQRRVQNRLFFILFQLHYSKLATIHKWENKRMQGIEKELLKSLRSIFSFCLWNHPKAKDGFKALLVEEESHHGKKSLRGQ